MGRKYTLDLSNIYEESPDKFYWLGFIAGDGNVAKKEARLRIELKSDDKKQLENFNEFMGSNTPLVSRVNNSGCHATCLSINSAELKRYLAKYNIVSNKSLIFTIPEDNIPQEFMFDFLRGLFDADGSLSMRSKNHNNLILEFTTGNLECAEQIKRILNIENKINSLNGGYLVRTEKHDQIMEILDKMYNNSTNKTRLERKYNIYRSLLE